MRKTKCKECKEYTVCDHCQGTGEIYVFTIQELREGKVAVFNDFYCDNADAAKLMNFVDHEGNYGGYDGYYWFDTDGNFWSSADENPKGLPTQFVKIFLEEIEQEEAIGKIVHDEFKKVGEMASQKTKAVEPEFKCSRCRFGMGVSIGPYITQHTCRRCGNISLSMTNDEEFKMKDIEQEEKMKLADRLDDQRNRFEEPEFKWGEEVEWTVNERYVPGIYLCRNPDDPKTHLILDTRESHTRTIRYPIDVRRPQKITITLSQIAEKFNYDRNKIKVDLEK